LFFGVNPARSHFDDGAGVVVDGSPSFASPVMELKLNPYEAKHAFVVDSGGMIWRTNDYGANWVSVSANLQSNSGAAFGTFVWGLEVTSCGRNSSVLITVGTSRGVYYAVDESPFAPPVQFIWKLLSSGRFQPHTAAGALLLRMRVPMALSLRCCLPCSFWRRFPQRAHLRLGVLPPARHSLGQLTWARHLATRSRGWVLAPNALIEWHLGKGSTAAIPLVPLAPEIYCRCNKLGLFFFVQYKCLQTARGAGCCRRGTRQHGGRQDWQSGLPVSDYAASCGPRTPTRAQR